MKSSAGLTLIEVMIAIVVLSVGVIAAASMQTTGLRASSTARSIQEATNTARTEIELQRQLVRSGAGPFSTTCVSNVATQQTCQVTTVVCRLVSNALACPGTGSGVIVADQITVTVVGPQSNTVTLVTVVARPL